MLTTILLSIPLVAALLLFFLRPAKSKFIALAAAIIELAVSFVVLNQFINKGPGLITDLPWIDSLGVRFTVQVDGISLMLVLLTTTLVPFIILSSFGRSFEKASAFYGLILLMEMALIGVFVARDGFLFYVFWEMALIPIYFICLIWGGEGRGRITLKFFIYTLAGSLVMLVSLIYLYFQTTDHSFSLYSLYYAGQSLPGVTQSLIFWGLFAAFAIKMPVFPFHTWQPDTYTTAPAQGTMLLSAIMLKMGIYGVIRWLLPMVPMGVSRWGSTAIVLSVIGVVYASCIALVQRDYKRLIAYSSIAHVGLIAAGTFTLKVIGVQGAMIQMISHGIVVFALFYIIDIIESRTNTRSIEELGGLRNATPALATTFLIILLASVALPFTSGFVGEFLLINSIFQYQVILGAVAGLTTILGAVYMLRAFQKSMLGALKNSASTVSDLTVREKIVLYPMVVLVVVIGIFPGPLLSLSEPAVASILSFFSDTTAMIK